MRPEQAWLQRVSETWKSNKAIVAFLWFELQKHQIKKSSVFGWFELQKHQTKSERHKFLNCLSFKGIIKVRKSWVFEWFGASRLPKTSKI